MNSVTHRSLCVDHRRDTHRLVSFKIGVLPLLANLLDYLTILVHVHSVNDLLSFGETVLFNYPLPKLLQMRGQHISPVLLFWQIILHLSGRDRGHSQRVSYDCETDVLFLCPFEVGYAGFLWFLTDKFDDALSVLQIIVYVNIHLSIRTIIIYDLLRLSYLM